MLNNVNKLEILIILLIIYHPINPDIDVVIEVLAEETDLMPKSVAIEESMQCPYHQ